MSPRTHRYLVVALVIAAAAARPGHGQESGFATERSVEDRVRDLEAALRKLEAPKADAGPRPTALAGWDDKNGFFLRSADEAHLLRVTGQVQADYRYFQDERDAVDFPNFLIRRARLGIEATVFRYYDFRLLPEFGLGNPRLLDAYLNARFADAFQVEAGKFKQPFSYEQLLQDRFVPTMERSLIDQLVPARDVGLMVQGYNLFDNRFDYQASVYSGVINGDQDADQNKEVAGRVAVRLFRGLGLPPWADRIHLGIAGTYGTDEGGLAPATLRTPDGVPWFQYLRGVRPGGIRARWSPEFAAFSGPVGLAAQYYEGSQELLAPGTGPAIEATSRGGYVLATLLLTGEERDSFSMPITPLVPFDPRSGRVGPGAWELVGRVSWLSLGPTGPDGLSRLMDPVVSATGATEVTVGFNWYWNRWVRVQANWEHARFNNPIRLGPTSANRLDRQNTLMARFQIVF